MRSDILKKFFAVLVLLALCAFAFADPPDPSAAATSAASEAPLPSWLSDREAEIYRLGFAAGFDAALLASQEEHDYVLNTNSMKFHLPGCDAVGKMKPKNRSAFRGTREQALSMGYVPCKICNP